MESSLVQRRVSRCLIILTTLTVILCIYWAKPILVPLAFAIFFSLLLMPLVDLLNKRLPRLLAATLTTALALIIVGALSFAIMRQFIFMSEALPQTVQSLLARMHSFTPNNSIFSSIRTGLEGLLSQASNMGQPKDLDAKEAFDFLALFVNPIGTVGIICIMILFIIWDKDILSERIVRALGRGELNVTTQALSDVRERVSRFLTTQLLLNVAFGITTCIGLLIIGIPNIVTWCVVTIFLRFVPYVGILIAAAIPILLAAGVGGWEVFYVIALYAFTEIVLTSVVEPIFAGQSAGISALALVFSAIFWTSIWGLPGLFLSTPLTVCLLMIGKHVPQLGFLHILLSSDPVIDQGARLYQRWLTQNKDDAKDFLFTELKTKPLLQVCDESIIPAVRLVECDRHKGRLSEIRNEKITESLEELEKDWSALIDTCDTSELKAKYTLSEYDQKFLSSRSVLCVAVSDQADQITSSLFNAILNKMLIPSSEISKEILVGEAVQKILNSSANIVVISSVPPFALAPVKYLITRLRNRGCKKRILIGLWGQKRKHSWNSLNKLSTGEERVAVNIREGLEIIHSWSTAICAENRLKSKVNEPIAVDQSVSFTTRCI